MSPWVRRRKIGAVGTAATSVALSLVVLTACGGGDGSDRQLSGPTVSAAGVTLTMPEGWAFLDNGEGGMVLAEREGDLTAALPQGPRLTVEPGSAALPDPEALVSAIAGTGAEGARPEVVEEPELAPVGAEEGVAIGLLEDEGGAGVMRRYVIVNVDGISVYQLLMEAPEDRWDGYVGTLEAILRSAAFAEVSAQGATALTVQRYFDRLEALAVRYTEEDSRLQENLDADTETVESAERALGLFQEFAEEELALVQQFVDDLEALEPPPELAQEHGEAVDAVRAVEAVLERVAAAAADAESPADLEPALRLLDESAAGRRLTESCAALQAIAEEHGVDVDLRCE